MQTAGKVIISMDAIFGLPRRKKAGQKFRDSLHGHLWFTDQYDVDKYVSSSHHKSEKQDYEGTDNFLVHDIILY